MPVVDVVVVSYNSRDQLRGCIEPLVTHDDLNVIVVDNASPDDSLASIADLAVQKIQRDVNDGFGSGCNAGWRAGASPYVLFLNPDARIEAAAIETLRDALDADAAGIAAPRIVDEHGNVEWSLRRYPSVASIYGQAVFAHRFAPRARWVDEVVRDEAAYRERAIHDWASGACLLTRRDLLESVGGFDQGFFLYCEEIDLCHRIADRGAPVLYVPEATCVHAGGASAPRAALLPVLATSRIRYARKWFGRFRATAYAAGVLLNALTHVAVARSSATRRGHLRSAAVAARALARD